MQRCNLADFQDTYTSPTIPNNQAQPVNIPATFSNRMHVLPPSGGLARILIQGDSLQSPLWLWREEAKALFLHVEGQYTVTGEGVVMSTYLVVVSSVEEVQRDNAGRCR